MTFQVPRNLMSRLVFDDEPVPETEVVPRIPADLPVVFTPGDPAQPEPEPGHQTSRP